MFSNHSSNLSSEMPSLTQNTPSARLSLLLMSSMLLSVKAVLFMGSVVKSVSVFETASAGQSSLAF